MSNSNAHALDENLLLPIAGQTLIEPERIIQTYTLHVTWKTPVNDLKSILKSYGLPVTGKKMVLVERLREYSQNQAKWNELFRPAPMKVRGGRGKKLRTLSAKRTAAMFPDGNNVVEYLNRYENDQRPIESITEEKTASNIAWANDVLQAYALRSMNRQSIETSAESVQAGDINSEESESDPMLLVRNWSQTCLLGRVGDNMGQPVSMLVRQLRRQVHGLEDNTSTMMRRIESKLDMMCTRGSRSDHRRLNQSSLMNPQSPPLSPLPSPMAITPSEILAAQPRAPMAHLNRTQDDEPASGTYTNVISEELAQRRTLVYLGEEKFYYDPRTIKSPPLCHFAKDISRLFVEWETSDLLVIEGRGIPLKYWPLFYQKKTRKDSEASKSWNAIKMTWGNWKFVCEEKDRLGSEENFWKRYTRPDGTRYGWQDILKALQDSRREAGTAGADEARRFFSDDRTSDLAKMVFTYVKKGETRVCTQDATIAQRWRALLEANEEVRASWEVMRLLDD